MNVNLPFGWFDILLVLLLAIGIFRGRKRGLSQEIFTMFLWLTIIFACAAAYLPLGDLLAGAARTGKLFGYIAAYIGIALLIALMFAPLKRSLGEKVVTADSFGNAEYYVGMPAGMLRFLCIVIASLALLNARYYTPQEIAAREKYQQEMYGSDFFPGLNALQQDVFEKSLTGPYIKKYLSFLLIKPTKPSGKPATRTAKKEAW